MPKLLHHRSGLKLRLKIIIYYTQVCYTLILTYMSSIRSNSAMINLFSVKNKTIKRISNSATRNG